MTVAPKRGADAPIDPVGELVSRRRAYVELADAILGNRDASATDALARLRLAGTAITKLLGDANHAGASAEERAVLRGLHQRILHWLRTTPDDGVAGIVLWRELVELVEGLMRINDRDELVAHDLHTLRACLEHLRTRELDACRNLAMSLIGRDRALDRRIRARVRSPVLRASLRRVLLSLVRTHARQAS